MTLGFGKKTRKDYHHTSLKRRYPIPLQNPFLDQSDFQYVGGHTNLATAEMQMDDCLYVSVPTRVNAVSRWVGKTEAEKELSSTACRSSDMLLDRPSYCTFSYFSEPDLSVQSVALPYLREGFDCGGEMK